MAGVRVSTSEGVVLCQVQESVLTGNELLSRVKEFNYLRVLFFREVEALWEIERQIGAASAVMQTLF